ncbi:hypothetical protein CVT24_003817 [Panaeolus cyanescens]|uniref:Major facilitator superfamily (MFS) profile domain-containing protein n=1 Tax=Panaeolus cyanescens TaxID=181874 RepID=A0A409YXB9_9AGAR|nr:hypothetical protein CVT24_003817 [Panaeolus cyanescens]
MASLLQPIALDSCKSSLRSRRRSSASVLQAAGSLVSCQTPSTHRNLLDEQVFIDDDDRSNRSKASPLTTSQDAPTVLICPPLAHVADRSSKIITSHHSNVSLPILNTDTTATPMTSSPPSASRKTSIASDYDDDPANPCKMERLKWRLASGYFAYFMCGWGDGVTGTVLPYFMKEFHISSQMTSLLYVGSTLGFIFGTLLVEKINKKLGTFDFSRSTTAWIPRLQSLSFLRLQKTDPQSIGYSHCQARIIGLFISSILHGTFFVIMASKGGFAALFCAYVVAAFARSILTAALNEYFASGPKSAISVSFAFWSIGGIASPLVCQAMMAIGIPWFKFYYGSLILSGLNVIFLVLTFRTTQMEFAYDRARALAVSRADSSVASTPIQEKCDKWEPSTLSPQQESSGRPPNALRLALCSPYQWAVQVFSMLYCGCETTTQCFMVTYLLATRNANPNTAGYVTAGFWGGITIGRLVWGHYTSRFLSKCLGLALQITIWVVNSNVQNAVAASVIGALYGPLFPACLTLANDLLPGEIRMVSMALISAFASIGAALFPFVAGTVASSQGIHTLTYVTVPLAAGISVFWALFPSKIATPKNMV